MNQGIPPDNEIFNAVGVENSQQIAEVGVDEHRGLSPSRRERSIPRKPGNGLWVPVVARIVNRMTGQDSLSGICASW
jgi:hypothetical protein